MQEGQNKAPSTPEKRLVPNKNFAKGASSKDEFFFGSQESGSNLSLNKILQNAQQSGNLNLSNRQLPQIPPEVFKLDELNFGEDGKWWEREALKLIDLSGNE